MRTRSYTLIVMVLVSSSIAMAENHFAAWHNSDKWDVAGDATLNPDNPRRLVGKAGDGILINGKDGKCPSLVTKRRDYRDVEVHVEFMVAKGSNSGVIFHGNYEIQILDSYGKTKPSAGDCGGIYPQAEAEPTYHHIGGGSAPGSAGKAPGAPPGKAGTPPGCAGVGDVTSGSGTFTASVRYPFSGLLRKTSASTGDDSATRPPS